MEEMSFKNDSFYSELMKLVVPIAVQSFMLALVSVSDAIMLGRLDQQSMASVSQAGNIQFFLNLLVMGFSAGIGIMSAQYWGKKDIKTIEKIALEGLKIILVLSGILTLLALFVPNILMRILTSDKTLIQLGQQYLYVVAPSYLFCGITQVYFALLKNTGNTMKSSIISCIAVVLNIIFNAILIFGWFGFPALGIKGAALATVIARLIELILAIVVTKCYGNVKLRWSGLFKNADKILYKDFLHYTLPVIGASIVWGVAYMFYSIILGHMNADVVAANSIVLAAKNLISCLIRGMGSGAGILIGNLLGANLFDKAKSYAKRITKLTILIGFCTGLFLVALTPVIMNITELTPKAEQYLKIMIVFTGLNIVAQAVNHVVLDGIFGAGGDAKFDMNTNIVFMWCICVPISLIAAFVLKLPASIVFCLCNMDEIIKLPVVAHHYRKYVWLRNITRDIA